MAMRPLLSAALGALLLSACGSTGSSPDSGAGSGGGPIDAGGNVGPGDGGASRSTFVISVRVNGSGSVRADAMAIDCSSACDASVAAGTRVSFTPTPANGWMFDGWGGLCTGPGACAVVVDSDRTLWATFVRASGGGGRVR